MKCEHCRVKEVDDNRNGAIKNAMTKRYCSDLCIGRAKFERRKAKKKPLPYRACVVDDCNNPITSNQKHAKTCSKSCGAKLREINKKKQYKAASDINSSSNPLIRLVNKFLQMPIS